MDIVKLLTTAFIQLTQLPNCLVLQTFAEKLFTQLNVRYKKETWETRLAMITVTARVIGVHKLLMDEKYYASYLNLVQPRQRDVTHVLAALIMVRRLCRRTFCSVQEACLVSTHHSQPSVHACKVYSGREMLRMSWQHSSW